MVQSSHTAANTAGLCHIVTDDGLQLAASRHSGRGQASGQKPGPTVLMAHGFGQTRQAWAGSQRRLAEQGFASLAWDARGHGQSQRNPLDLRYRATQFVDDVVAVARTQPRPPILVGASMGGLTGLMAQAASTPFSALVLVDITPRWEAAGVARILAFMGAHPDGFDSFEQAAEAIAHYLPHRAERKTPEQLRHLLMDRGDGRLGWHWDPRLLAEFIPDTDHIADLLEHATRALTVPVLLISGGRSDLVSESHVSHFLELAPHARHVRLPQATHMLAGDDNDAFTEALLPFLGQITFTPAVTRTAPVPGVLS